jgi:WD40 repeat protein
VVTSERDHAVRAESEAQMQRQKAEAETRRAQLQLANSLISQGDALVTTGEFRGAYARFADAEATLRQIGESFATLDLSLVRLYRVSPPPLWTSTVPGGKPRAWVMLPTGKELLVAGNDKQYHEVDLLTGELVRSYGDCHGIACLAAGETAAGPIVVAGGFKGAYVIDPISGAVIREVQDDRAMRLCVLSPDGSTAASINQAGSIILWEPATLKRLAECKHAETMDLAFSHDGSMIASVYNQNTVAIWNARTGKQIRVFEEAPDRRKNYPGSRSVAFSTDDRVVYCGEAFGVIAVCLSGR